MESRTVFGFAPMAGLHITPKEAEAWRVRMRRAAELLGAEVVDCAQNLPGGVIAGRGDAAEALRILQAERVDGVFLPHIGEDSGLLIPDFVQEIKKPVLLYAENPSAAFAEGGRPIMPRTGFFASAKLLRHRGVPFSYLPVCGVEEEAFARGLHGFAVTCKVLADFRGMRILQLGGRDMFHPAVDADERTVAAKLGVEIIPVSLLELEEEVQAILTRKGANLSATDGMIRRKYDMSLMKDDTVETMAAYKLAVTRLCEQYRCSACALQCRDALQNAIGIYPCAVNGLLAEDGIPVACDSDLMSALTAVLLRSAAGAVPFFADWAMVHPKDENGILLHSCGCAPVGFAERNSRPAVSFGTDGRSGGCGRFPMREGEVTLCRMEQEGERFRLIVGRGTSCAGPETEGTYLWVHLDSRLRWERTLLENGMRSAFTCVYGNGAEVLREVCHYLPFVDCIAMDAPVRLPLG